MRPAWITFTGIDDGTDIDELVALNQAYNGLVEFGALVGGSIAAVSGRPRYPSRYRLDQYMKLGWEKKLTLALHVCGSAGREVLSGNRWPDIPGINRVQINATAKQYAGVPLDVFAAKWQRPIIVQARGGSWHPYRIPHQLMDDSGGHGVAIKTAPARPAQGTYGYAGGIGPDNVLAVLEQIPDGSPFWIDMESSLRTEDGFFSLDKCRKVLELVFA